MNIFKKNDNNNNNNNDDDDDDDDDDVVRDASSLWIIFLGVPEPPDEV